MNIRTNIHAGQDGTIDVDKLSALVQELDCQISPFEMIGLANRYCKNLDPNKLAEIAKLVGVGGGAAQFLPWFGG
jgi:hypothetical protein